MLTRRSVIQPGNEASVDLTTNQLLTRALTRAGAQ
jgi:hypothetical protein